MHQRDTKLETPDYHQVFVLNEPVCVDDYGDEVYRCHWTSQLVAVRDAVITGGIMPGVKVRFVAVRDYHQAMKESQKGFNAMDSNCNSCKHLQRVKHAKSKAGFLYGKCSIDSTEPKLYKIFEDVMMFHPDDYMGMTCWEGRLP